MVSRLLAASGEIALGGEGPVLKAALDTGGLGLHLTEGRAGVGGLALGFAALVGLASMAALRSAIWCWSAAVLRSVWASSCSDFSTFFWTWLVRA